MSHESQNKPVEVINPRYTEQAIKEKAYLKELKKQPSTKRFMGYVKLSGPGFMNAAFTLGAGSFASSVTLGAAYGYDMLWIPLYSFAFGIFMLALATRFVTGSEMNVIEAQDKFHGKFFGSFATGLVAYRARSPLSYTPLDNMRLDRTRLPPCSRWWGCQSPRA